MAGRAVADILAPEVIAKTISQLELPGTTLQKIFGFGPGGGAGEPWDARDGSYDVFDVSRRVTPAIHPEAPSANRRPQKVGKVRFTIPRHSQTISLLDERIHNQRKIGGPTSELDRGGENYIAKQEEILAQEVANLIEFQTAGMIRGSYMYNQSGERLEHVFSGGQETVDFQIPAGNKTKLNMLSAGDILGTSWDNVASDIPADLFQINEAFVNLTGDGLAHCVLTSVGWQYIVNNTKVKAQGGTANVVFERINKVGAGEFSAVIRAIPWLTFHIVDYGLEIWDGPGTADSDYSFTKLIEDDHAAFFPEPSRRWVNYLDGGAWVTEGPNGPTGFRHGFYPYAYKTHDPSGWKLNAEFNGMPALERPKAMAYGLIKY